ncbi:unnamed protein product, partial [marine sediment metagenome]
QIIGIIESSDIVTGYTISKNYSLISLTATSSFSNPLITTFSHLDVNNQDNQINSIFNMVFKFSSFLLLLITGVLFFLSEFFLYIVYGESYLTFTIILKLNLISIVFAGLGNILLPLLNARKKVKLIPLMYAFNLSILITFFLIGLFYYGIIGMLLGLIISKFLIFLTQIIISKRIGKISMNNYKTFFLNLSFFIALIFTSTLSYFLYRNFNLSFLFDMLAFLLIFLGLIILFRIFSHQELNLLESIFISNRRFHIIIRKFINISKKIIRK